MNRQSKEFQDRVASEQGIISSKEPGPSLIRDINAARKTVWIAQSSEANVVTPTSRLAVALGIPTDATIWYNPNKSYLPGDPSWISLAHELVEARMVVRGESWTRLFGGDHVLAVGTPLAPHLPFISENSFRSAHGLEIRRRMYGE